MASNLLNAYKASVVAAFLAVTFVAFVFCVAMYDTAVLCLKLYKFVTRRNK